MIKGSKQVHLFGIIFLYFFACFPFSTLRANNLTSLAKPPNWEQLTPYQHTITQSEFKHYLETIYTPSQSQWKDLIFGENYVDIRTKSGHPDYYRLHFATQKKQASLNSNDLRKKKVPHIVLDPGHIGGEFAEMEFRHFKMQDYPPVREGELTLEIAKATKRILENAGYTASLTREKNEPVTSLRPKDLKKEALDWFARVYKFDEPPPFEQLTDKQKQDVERRQRILFYRTAEIHARAAMIKDLNPDLVICLHINAAPWPTSDQKTLSDKNHMHFLVNGTYLESELEYDDIRFQMISRILKRYSDTEIPLAKHMAYSFAQSKPTPPFMYTGKNATNVELNPYIWSRNLIANRIFDAPVAYLEPYVANSTETFNWIQGKENTPKFPNFIEEYASSVANGIFNFYKN